MAVGSYGIIRPADVSPEDIEIYFHYVPNRNSTSEVTLKRLSSSDVLTPVFHNTETTDDTSAPNTEILGGLYNLKLSATDFSDTGIYTLHIRPKQIRTSITDCGILASLPSVRGLIVDLSNVPAADRNKFTPQGLVGYRVEYINSADNKKIPNFSQSCPKIKKISFYLKEIFSE